MKNLQITKENQHIIKKYYVDLYKICLNDYGICDEKAYDDINNYVDDRIYKYFNETKSKKSFSEYIGNHNFLRKKYNVSFLNPKEKVKLIRQGNYKYIETLIEFYKTRLEYNISMLDLNSKIENKQKLIDDGKFLIKRMVEKYFNEKNNSDFVIYMQRILKHFYFKNGIKIYGGENDIVIDNINDVNDDKEELYDIYYKLAKKRIKNSINLPEDKFDLFLEYFIKEKINLYFQNEKKECSLRNYMESYIRRNSYLDIKLLVDYNIFSSDYYDESVRFLHNKVNIIIDEFIKKHNISSITLKWKLKKESLYIAKAYLDKCIANKMCYPYEQNVSGKLTNILADETKVKEFDDFNIELARNGNLDDKKIEFEILLEELSYLKDLYKNKYVYYDDASTIEEKINDEYYRIIKSFIYDILDADFKKNYKTYISNRLYEVFKRYSINTKKKFDKNHMKEIYKIRCNDIVYDYVNQNKMTDEEYNIFIRYVNSAFENYIDKGSYDIDIRWYMKNIIDSYDYEFAKQVLAIKEYKNANIKVLKRPNIK